MPALRSRAGMAVSAAIVAVFAIAFGATFTSIVASSYARSAPEAMPTGDRALSAIKALKTSHLYVAPDAADLLTAAQREQINRAAAAANPEIFITVWNPSRDDGFYLDSDGAEQIANGVDKKGVYLLAGNGTQAGTNEYGVNPGYVNSDLRGEFDKALLRYIAAIDATGDNEPVNNDSDYWGGLTGGTIFGILAVLAGYPTLMLLIGLARLATGRRFLVPACWFHTHRYDPYREGTF